MKKAALKQHTESSVEALESLDSKASLDSGVNLDSRVDSLDSRVKEIDLSEIIVRVAANSGELKEITKSQENLGEKFSLKTLWVLKTHKISVNEQVSLVDGKLRAVYSLPESSMNDDSEVKNFLGACASAKSNKACGYLRTLLQSCLMLYKNVELENLEILAKDVRKESKKIRESLTKTLLERETLYDNMDAYLGAYVADFNARNPRAQITVAKIPHLGEALIEGQRLFIEQQEASKRSARFAALKEALSEMTDAERKALLH
jgi:hypothetical protein